MCSNRGMVEGLLGFAIAALVIVVPVAAVAEPAVTVDMVDHEGLLDAVKAARGKVVVLDCWSTSCPPCVKEFPGLVAIHEKHGADVACLSLSLDYEGIGSPDEVVPPVRQFLERQRATFRNLVATEDSDAMCRKLDIVSVPAVFVWDREGRLARKFDDDSSVKSLGRAFTYADVEATVKECLAR